jgi:phosphate transport system protein
MEEIAVSMLKDSLDAFARKDLALAQSVLDRDDEVDGLKKKVFEETAALMRSDPSAVQKGIELLLISRNFERIADHSTNIAEDVIFMAAGKDIRHGAGRPPEL